MRGIRCNVLLCLVSVLVALCASAAYSDERSDLRDLIKEKYRFDLTYSASLRDLRALKSSLDAAFPDPRVLRARGSPGSPPSNWRTL